MKNLLAGASARVQAADDTDDVRVIAGRRHSGSAPYDLRGADLRTDSAVSTPVPILRRADGVTPVA